jgi:hypothetical protein
MMRVESEVRESRLRCEDCSGVKLWVPLIFCLNLSP